MKRETGKLHAAHSTKFIFKGSQPNKATNIMGTAIRASSSWAGMCYLLAPKSCQVATSGNKEHFVDLLVAPNWIFNMVTTDKMDYSQARGELNRCTRGISKNLSDLETWRSIQVADELHRRTSNIQLQLRSTMKSFRDFKVVNEWLGSFSGRCVSRKPFLVISGPSGVGKSEFVRSLFELGEVPELNCAGLEHVCVFLSLIHI